MFGFERCEHLKIEIFKNLNVEATFLQAYARAIGGMAFSSILINWDKLNFKSIMKNIFICAVAGVALVWGMV